jgi:hypothetical protein
MYTFVAKIGAAINKYTELPKTSKGREAKMYHQAIVITTFPLGCSFSKYQKASGVLLSG